MPEREKLFNVRVADNEMTMIRELSEAYGLSLSDTIRQLVRRAHAELSHDKQRKRSKR